MLSTIRRTDPISKIKESSRLSENFPSRLTFGKRFHYFPSVPYSLPIRQTYSTCRTANSFLRLLSDHRLYTTCSSTGGRLTARIWQRLNLLVGSRIDPYLFHRNNYTPRSIPFTIFSWSTTIPTYLIQKDDSYTAYIARDDFYNTRPRPDPYSSSPFHDDYTSTRSNLKRPTQRKIITYTIDRFQPCVNQDFSLSLTCYRHSTERKKQKCLSWMLEKFDTKRMVGRDDRSIRSNEGDVSGQLNRSQKNFAGLTSLPMIILLAPGGQ